MEIKNFFERIQNGLTPEAYMGYFEREAENSDSEYQDYMKLNLQRTSRIDKTYFVSDELQNAIKNIETPQLWFVITEPWCGDSAQTLPYITKMTKCNDKITMRILLRDQNLDIIDQYLTNGTRSIPKLVVFDEHQNELFTWGPRPQAAVEVIQQAKAEGLEKEKMYEKLHLWYGRNRGKEIEKEFLEILTA